MQTNDQRPAIFLCLLLSMYAMYAGFTCIRIIAGHDVRPDLAVWAILGALVLLGATAARNSSSRARASRAREDGLGATAYGRLDMDPAGLGQGLHRAMAARMESPSCPGHAYPLRRAGEISEAEWEAQRLSNIDPIAAAEALAPGMLEPPPSFNPNSSAALDRLLAAAGEPDPDEEPALPGHGDELLVEMVQELDDMLGDLLSDPAGISPDSLRTIGRVWRDVCMALAIEQETYAHRAPEAWDSTPEQDWDDGAEARGEAEHEAAGG